MSDTQTEFIQQITMEPADVRKKRLAESLINSKFAPPGWIQARWQAMEAQAYHNLTPYPMWSFNDWKTEERGPLPRCLPLARSIVKKSAQWLFGREVQVSIPGNLNLEESFRKLWLKNQMRTRLLARAERAGVEGGFVFKWSVDETREVPLSFQLLSAIDETRAFYDSHDKDILLMLRIQYPVWNPQNGEYYLYREEWTDEEEVHYRPIPCRYATIARKWGMRLVQVGSLPYVFQGNEKHDPDNYDKWEIISRELNKFGTIPAVVVQNIDTDDVCGKGDLWTDAGGGLFRVFDRFNLAYHLEDRSNQFDSSPLPVIIDAKLENDVLPLNAIQPGGSLNLKSDALEGENRQARVELLEPGGKMRDAMADYIRRLERSILDAANSVMLDEEQITNKGALTEATLTQMYAPLLLLTDAKRQTYGENGICKVLEKCAISMKNLGVTVIKGVSEVNSDNEETYDCQLLWQDYFKLSEEEKATRVARVQSEMDTGLLTHELAIEIVAKTENIDNVLQLKKDLAVEIQRREDTRQAQVEQEASRTKFLQTESDTLLMRGGGGAKPSASKGRATE